MAGVSHSIAPIPRDLKGGNMETTATVLWVDDDSAKLRVVEDLLDGLNVEFIHSNSIEDALAKIGDAKHIPVLLLDAILAPPRDSELTRLLGAPDANHPEMQNGHQPERGDSGDRNNAPLEKIFQTSYENLERGGQLFQQICRIKEISFDKIIMISYVKESTLRNIGYIFDKYISKLDLFDKLGVLRNEIESTMTAMAG